MGHDILYRQPVSYCDRNTNRYSEALIYNPSYIMSETEKNLLEMLKKDYPLFCKE